MDLEILLADGDLKDISGSDLYDELRFLRNHIKESCYTPSNILEYICSNSLAASLANIFIALRIFLTLPTSVASAERSFSKLKLIKTYIRSTMRQDRLDALTTLSIAHEIAKDLNEEELIDKFATIKARKIRF
jgi:hypothetical protein